MLIVYQGCSDTENTLLNLAGVLALVIATVPTSRPLLLCSPVDPVDKQAGPSTSVQHLDSGRDAGFVPRRIVVCARPRRRARSSAAACPRCGYNESCSVPAWWC